MLRLLGVPSDTTPQLASLGLTIDVVRPSAAQTDAFLWFPGARLRQHGVVRHQLPAAHPVHLAPID